MAGEILWRPSPARIDTAQLTAYRAWLDETRGLRFDGYEALWQWSVDSLEDFWQSIWDRFGFRSPTPYARVLARRTMPGAKWFDGATLNYAGEVFRIGGTKPDAPAIVFRDEAGDHPDLSWGELERRVAALATTLVASGVKSGDRVVAYLPNVPETIVAFLAVASIGAVWSVCAPDMGPVGVLDRFRQIEPVALIACDGYRYGGRVFDRRDTVAGLLAELATVATLIVVPIVDRGSRPAVDLAGRCPRRLARTIDWADALDGDGPSRPLACASLPFDHPLWIVYSSGTTGAPKAIVHGHGGAALVGVKDTRLQLDVAAGDRFHWYSSSGWIMWNAQVAALLAGATVCLYDGNAGSPDLNTLWRFAADRAVSFFGAGAAFYGSCLKAGVEPARDVDLSALRSLGSTGSPLSDDAYRWVYRHVKSDVWLAPISGGTDIAAAFTCGSVTLPVRLGEMQCRGLGAAAHAFDEAGHALVGEVGELVCTEPMPSMPLYFWNDPGDARLIESYFDMYPGVWRHGDWIRFIPHDEDDGTRSLAAVIYGRSDATINRHGIRMGTAELYRAVEALPEVLDSLVVDLEYLGRDSWMGLFVVLRDGHTLDDALAARINGEIRRALSARHVPDDVYAIAAVPRTLSGKKLELPVKKLLLGQPVERVVNRDAMANPDSLDWFVALAAERSTRAV